MANGFSCDGAEGLHLFAELEEKLLISYFTYSLTIRPAKCIELVKAGDMAFRI